MSFGKCIFFSSIFMGMTFWSVSSFANCTEGSAGRRCYEGGNTVYFPKTGGKCTDYGSLGTPQSITCINADESDVNKFEDASYQSSDEAPQVVPAAADENDADFSVPDNSPIDI